MSNHKEDIDDVFKAMGLETEEQRLSYHVFSVAEPSSESKPESIYTTTNTQLIDKDA